MKTKLTRYPIAYSKILLTLPENGTPLQLMLESPAEANAERLRFYNFLKFLRRNPNEAAHFSGRHNLVMVRVEGSVISFNLRGGSGKTKLDEAFEQALAAANIPGAIELPVRMIPDQSDQITADDLRIPELDQPMSNPFDHLDEDKPK